MQDLTHIELSELYDLLAQQTNRYMKMLSDGATKQEFDQCREIILSIQAEIHSRKGQKAPSRDSRSTNNPRPGYLNNPGN
jgi:hypothetical protein